MTSFENFIFSRMAKGKKGKKSKQDEDAEWDALEAKKTAQAAEPKPAAEPKKGTESFKIVRSIELYIQEKAKSPKPLPLWPILKKN